MRKNILAILIGIVITSSVYAVNLSFLEYTPGFYFTDADWALSKAASSKALDSARDNTKVSWKNPKTNAQGYFVPFNTNTKNGITCRSLKIFSEARKVKGESVYRFCKIKGEWKVAH